MGIGEGLAHFLKAALVAFLLSCFALSAYAADVIWNGGGSDNLASNPANWAGGIVPLDDDAVSFNNTSTKSCTWNTNPISASLNLNSGYTGTVTINSGLTVTGNVIVSGGKLSVNNVLKIVSTGATVPPTAPSSLIAAAISSSRIDLSWTDNSHYETGFKIERKTGVNGVYEQIGTAGANAIAYSNTGLLAGLTYYYRVRAYNASGDSLYSNEAYATTLAASSPPTAITNSAANVNGSSVTLNGAVNPNGAATAAYFEWGTTTSYGNSTPPHSIGSGNSSVNIWDSITGLSPGATYHYRVKASNGVGTTYGNDVSFTTSLPISITIDSPSNGAIIYQPDIMVKGTLPTPWMGVTVNGIVANVYGYQFVANHVPLTEGANTITGIAKDAAGNTSTASITVYAVTTGNYISLTSDTESGIAPLSATLRIDGSFSIDNSTITVSGPAQPQIINLSPFEYTATMTSEGIYYFTSAVTGPDSNQYQDTMGIVVMNQAQIDNLLKGIWNAMTTSLSFQDISTAITYISAATRANYQQMFNTITTQLPAMVDTQTEFNFNSINDRVAFYELVTLESGELYSYEVIFVKDADGRWYIQDF